MSRLVISTELGIVSLRFGKLLYPR
jgi:hypothetical protein